MATQGKRPNSAEIKDMEFYEVMQADLRRPYSSVFPDAAPSQESDEAVPVGRTTAIVTLVSLGVAVAILAFIIVAGIRAAIG